MKFEEPANDNLPPKAANNNTPPPFGRTSEAQWSRLANVAAKLGRFHMLAAKAIAKHDEEQTEKMRTMKVVRIETAIVHKTPDIHDHLLKAMELQLKDADDWLMNSASRHKTSEEIEQFAKQVETMIADNLPYFPDITQRELSPEEADVLPFRPKGE